MKILITIPAYNEEKILRQNVLAVYQWCRANLAADWRIVIANNLSSDRTGEIAEDLANELERVKAVAAEVKGKGSAIRAGWESETADIYIFMDADIATDLSALPLLINAITAGSDVAVGSRFLPQSKVRRAKWRWLFSFGYRLLVRLTLRSKISDLPCGFKAINQKVKERILPRIKNNGWFFDSELVLLAENQGFSVTAVPVIWHDPREGADASRVNPLAVSLAYWRQLRNLKKRLKK